MPKHSLKNAFVLLFFPLRAGLYDAILLQTSCCYLITAIKPGLLKMHRVIYPEKNKVSGRSLCRLRMVKGMPQKLVATRLIMSQQAYSKIESMRSVRPDIVDAVLKVLGSNMAELKMIQQIMRSFEL